MCCPSRVGVYAHRDRIRMKKVLVVQQTKTYGRFYDHGMNEIGNPPSHSTHNSWRASYFPPSLVPHNSFLFHQFSLQRCNGHSCDRFNRRKRGSCDKRAAKSVQPSLCWASSSFSLSNVRLALRARHSIVSGTLFTRQNTCLSSRHAALSSIPLLKLLEPLPPTFPPLTVHLLGSK